MASFKQRASRWHEPAAVALAAVFSLWLYVGLAITRTGSLSGYVRDVPHALLSVVFVLASWVCLTLVVGLLLKLLDRLAGDGAARPKDASAALSAVVFAVILACWLPYLVASFPGLINFDYFNQLNQFVGARPLSNHHPVAMTFVFGALYEIGHHLGGATGGLYLTVWVQALCLDGLFAYAHHWLCRMDVRRGVRIATVAFCALCPIFPLYACVLVKDTLSATALGLFALQVAVRSWCDRTSSPTPRMASLPAVAAVGALTSLTRANCVYLVIGTLVVCLFCLRRTSRLRLVAAIAAIAACFFGWTNVLLPAAGVTPSDTALVISIPLQQTGAYAHYSPDDATDDERSAIEGLLGVSYDEVGDLYTPNIVDPLQTAARDGAGDRARLSAYLGAWAAQGLRHPGIYADALLKANVGYWYPHMAFEELQDLDYTQNTPASHLAWMQGLGYGFTGDLSDMGSADSPFVDARATMQQLLARLSGTPVLGLVLQPAFYTWFCLAVGVWSATRRRATAPLLTLVILLFLVECVSPLAASLRYALPLVVLAPLLFGASLARGSLAPRPRHAA